MYLAIDGKDFTSYIASDGFSWQRNDVDGENAGRTQDAFMHRDRIAIKMKLNIKTKDLPGGMLRQILKAIKPQYVTVTYDDPEDGRRTASFYSNNAQASCSVVYENGEELWSGISFPLVER